MSTLSFRGSIGALASAAAVNVETIRFYQRKGLMPEPEKPYGSIRRYRAAELARVRFIKSAQRLGFSLEEIGEFDESTVDAVLKRAASIAPSKRLVAVPIAALAVCPAC